MDNKLKSHFINLYFLALCDGNFDSRELNTIIQIAEEKGVTKEDFEKSITTPTNHEIYVPDNFMDKILFLYDFIRVILADEIIENEEKETFLKLCYKVFHFEKDESEELFEWLVNLAQQKLPSEKIHEEINKLIQ